MKVCVAGKNNIAVDCLYRLISLVGKENVCVVLNKTDSYKNNWQKSLGFYAELENISIQTLEDVEKIEDLIFLSLEFDKIIKPERFKSKRLYNIHFSHLPEYKGMFTSLLPILHGKSYSGVTLHEIDSGIDTGRIISQRKINISGYSCEDLYYSYLEAGTKLVCEFLEDIINNKIKSRKQSSFGSTYFSKSSVDFTNNEINIYQTANQIEQFVRAFTFPVYQVPQFNDIEVYKCEIIETNSFQKPGEILKNDDEKLVVSTIDYDVILYKFYYNLLVQSAENNDYSKILSIIKFIPNLNKLNKNGWSPLIIACYNGSKEVVEILMANGVNPNRSNLKGTTPLMFAKDSYLRNRDFGILELLLNSGARLDLKDVHGKTIFDYTDDRSLLQFLKNYQ